MRAIQRPQVPGTVSAGEEARLRNLRGTQPSPPRLSADSLQEATPLNHGINSHEELPRLAATLQGTPFTIQPSPVKLHLLSQLLSPHPNRDLCNTVLHRFRIGADIGFRGSLRAQSGTANNTSALIHADAVSQAIRLEVERGHTCGPFRHIPLAPFKINPLSARLKPDGSARLILDLSQPSGESVNDGIDPAEFTCSYSSVDEAVALIFKNGGRGALLAKADIKHAFRLIPVRPDQWHLLGYHWNGAYYFDVRLSFGSRSSPRIFNDFADCLAWLFSFHANHPSIRHYLDDFFLAAPSAAAASRAYRTILTLTQSLGVPLAADKCVPPTTRLVLLGVETDTDRMTIALPADKQAALISSLHALSRRTKATRRELLSVVGSLMHAAKCIPPGRGFTRRILDAALSVERSGHRVRLTAALRRDIQWWVEFLPQWNGTFPLIPPRPWTACLEVYTDSSGTAGAAVHGDRWFYFVWPAAATEAADCSNDVAGDGAGRGGTPHMGTDVARSQS